MLSHHPNIRHASVLALIAATLMVSSLVLAAGAADRESQKIEFLIASIETLQDAQFIRNGSAYDGKAAAAHLRLKLKKAGARVRTVDDFIRYCGAGSSMSGVAYLIRFSDGRVVTSEAFLRMKLAEFKPEASGVSQGRGQ